MSLKGQKYRELEALLDLDGEVFPMESGHWTKIEARVVAPAHNRPHGIKYSLTLHDRHNKRILGYDNAHAFKSSRRKYGCSVRTWDHKHKRENVEKYKFESAARLLDDFWADVDETLAKGRKR